LIKFFADVRNFLVKVTLHLDKAEATVNENNKGVAAKKFMLKLQFGSDSGKFADFAVPSVWEAVGMMQGRIDKLQKGTKKRLDEIMVSVPAAEKRFCVVMEEKELQLARVDTRTNNIVAKITDLEEELKRLKRER